MCKPRRCLRGLCHDWWYLPAMIKLDLQGRTGSATCRNLKLVFGDCWRTTTVWRSYTNPRGPTISQHMVTLPQNLSARVAEWMQYKFKLYSLEHQITTILINLVERSPSCKDLKWAIAILWWALTYTPSDKHIGQQQATQVCMMSSKLSEEALHPLHVLRA